MGGPKGGASAAAALSMAIPRRVLNAALWACAPAERANPKPNGVCSAVALHLLYRIALQGLWVDLRWAETGAAALSKVI